jgi:hypothetical protein
MFVAKQKHHRPEKCLQKNVFVFVFVFVFWDAMVTRDTERKEEGETNLRWLLAWRAGYVFEITAEDTSFPLKE